MRVVAILLGALFVPAIGHGAEGTSPAPVTASWERCETYLGASVCAWTVLVQNGARVCGVQQDFATNAYYTHRLIGTAEGNRVHFDRICGDPGSETGTFCTGSAPENAVDVGWGHYDRTLHLCDGFLSDGPDGCSEAPDDMAMLSVPVGSLPLSEDDRAWLDACASGLD